MLGKKPHPHAKLLNLPECDRERVVAWLTDGVDGDTTYAAVRAEIAKTMGVQTSEAALVNFWRRVVQPRRLRAAALDAEALAGEASRSIGSLDAGAEAALKQAAFEVLANPERNAKDIGIVMGLALELQKIALEREKTATATELARLRLEQGNKRLRLDRERFETALCESFLKWFRDDRAREIAMKPVSNAEKIAELRQTYFADVDELEGSGKVVLPV